MESSVFPGTTSNPLIISMTGFSHGSSHGTCKNLARVDGLLTYPGGEPSPAKSFHGGSCANPDLEEKDQGASLSSMYSRFMAI